MNHTIKTIATLDTSRVTRWHDRHGSGLWWGEGQGSMGPVTVVMGHEHSKTPLKVLLVENQQPVEAFGPGRAHANAHAERFVRTIKESCLNRLILFGGRSLDRAIGQFVAHYHYERNHQGRDNQLLFFDASVRRHEGPIACRARLGGLLKYYHRPAA